MTTVDVNLLTNICAYKIPCADCISVAGELMPFDSRITAKYHQQSIEQILDDKSTTHFGY